MTGEPLEPIIMVTSVDRHYVAQLAAMARSVECHTTGPVRMHVIDGGLTEGDRDRVARSLASKRVQLVWLVADTEALRNLKLSFQITLATYFRLEMGELLPASCSKALYLDCDIIVRGNLRELWDMSLGGKLFLAAADSSQPFMDAAVAVTDYASRFLCQNRHPLLNHRDLGIPPTARYFNAGVLLVDLGLWRRRGAGKAALEYLRTNRQHVRLWDQDGMNAVLWADWGELPPAWNFTVCLFSYPHWRTSPYGRSDYEQALADPKIVHYAGLFKPWKCGYGYAHKRTFFDQLDQTEFRGAFPIARFEMDWLGDASGWFCALIWDSLMYMYRFWWAWPGPRGLWHILCERLSHQLQRTLNPLFGLADWRMLWAGLRPKRPPRLAGLLDVVGPYTMVDRPRLETLDQLLAAACRAGVTGDVVECGVCNGGTAALLAAGILHEPQRMLWLYDTFEGLPAPSGRDGLLAQTYEGAAVGKIGAVSEVLERVSFPAERVRLRKGEFTKTFAEPLPREVALLHVDADWYESVLGALETFYPLVADGGVIVLDDFGHWEGTRRAFYEFCRRHTIEPLLERSGYTQAYWFKGREHNR